MILCSWIVFWVEISIGDQVKVLCSKNVHFVNSSLVCWFQILGVSSKQEEHVFVADCFGSLAFTDHCDNQQFNTNPITTSILCEGMCLVL